MHTQQEGVFLNFLTHRNLESLAMQGVRQLIFTNTSNSTLDNKYIVGSCVSSTMVGHGIRSALMRRANNTSDGQPCGCFSNNIIGNHIKNLHDIQYVVEN